MRIARGDRGKKIETKNFIIFHFNRIISVFKLKDLVSWKEESENGEIQ